MSATSRPTGPSGRPLVGRGDADRSSAVTRSLLGYGVVAGPLYTVVGLVQALVRPGFDLARHDLSLLANGPFGWVQVANLVVTGAAVVSAAAGLRRSFRVTGGGRGTVWGPRLLAAFGIGLVGAGVFVADPMNGFPLGTPEGPPVRPSSSGLGHLVLGGAGFLCLVATCLVLARAFAARGQRRLAALSVVTGVVYLVAFGGLASGSSASIVVLGFWAALLLAWTWLAVVSIDRYRRTPFRTPASRSAL